MFLMETPVWVILIPFVLIYAAAFFSAWQYRNTHDLKKSCKTYFPIGTVVVLFSFSFGLPLTLGIFMIFFGFIAMMFISNRFFYSK